jgi:hypothetical protein
MATRRPTKMLALVAMMLAAALTFGEGISFAKTETTSATYYEDENHNLCVGLPAAGGFSEGCEWKGVTGSYNVGVGPYALKSDTVGSGNVATGSGALFSNINGVDNDATGGGALFTNTAGNGNVATGQQALYENTTGSENVATGEFALFKNTTGSSNVAIGFQAGDNLTTGSHNIDVSNEEGVAGESHTTRIGSEGEFGQSKTFISGIFPTEVSGKLCIVKVNESGQLGCNPEETGGPRGPEGKEGKEGTPGKEGAAGPAGPAGSAAVATFASSQNVASGQCLNYSEDEAGGSCPKKASGFPISSLLSGPVPANGASVSDLYTETNATVSGKDSVLVEVIDNTTGVTLLSCVVTKAGKGCSNSGSSAPVHAGDKLEVRITASGPSGNNKQWQVTFRY